MTQTNDSKEIRIINAEPKGYSPDARTLLAQCGKLMEKNVSRDELLNDLRNYDVLIVRLAHQIDREVIDAGQRLKAIVTATTGLDHIDIEYAQERGITVLSLQGETDFLSNVSATAEHTWALLLGLLRRIIPSSMAVKRGEWNRNAFRGRELDSKHLGIVGLGRLGRKVACYGHAFGMKVGAYDPYTNEWMDSVWRAFTLAELLKWSNVLSLHVPLTYETEGMITATELALLPPKAVLINTSRGQLIDEVAMVQALVSGHLAGVALDVVSQERNQCLRCNSPLLEYASTHDNLLITPHIGGATYESMAKTEIFMAIKLAQFLNTLKKESKAL